MSRWEEVEFGELSSFRNGLNFKHDSYGKGCQIIGVSDFGDRLIPDYQSLSEINTDGIVKDEDYLKKGDIVFVRSNGNKNLVGRSMFINESNRKLVYSGFCIRARINSEKACPEFYAYFFRTTMFRQLISQAAGGANIQNLNQGMLSRAIVPLPPVQTQQKIASILSTYDYLIENNLKRIKLLEEIAQRTYEEWFVKFRVNGEELAIDESTGLPEGWELKEIQFFGKVVTGKTPSTLNAANFDGTVPFVKTPDMHGLPYVIKTNQTLSRLGAELQSKKFIPKNSIMVSCIGSAGVYALASTDCQTNQQINAVDFFKPHYSFYFYCLAGNLKPLLEGLGSNGATMTNVNKGKFEKINVIHPGDEILIDFHEKIKSNFELILTMQKQNEILKEARDILLPRLMSGEIDVEKMALAAVATK